MRAILFDGQQEGERILYEIRPHPIAKYLAVTRGVLLAIALYAVILMIASVVPSGPAVTIRMIGIVINILLLVATIWWNNKVYGQSQTYITDRRIMRFDIARPRGQRE